MRDKSLAVFTLLTQMAVGMVWTIGLFGNQGPAPLKVSSTIFISSALGLLTAFFHLGKPLRGWRALTNFRSSWLSREILFATLFTGTSVVYLTLEWVDFGSTAAGVIIIWIMSLLGLVLIYSMAKAYQLRTIPAWNSWVTLTSFLVTAWLLGMLMVIVLIPDTSLLVGLWPMLLLGTQLGLTYLWVARLSKGKTAAQLSVEKLTHRYRAVFWLRIGFGVLGLLFLAVLIFGWGGISVFSVVEVVFISELLGRLLFYSARVRVGV